MENRPIGKSIHRGETRNKDTNVFDIVCNKLVLRPLNRTVGNFGSITNATRLFRIKIKMLESRKKKRENRSYSMKCCNSNALGMIFADSIDPFAGLSFFYWTSPAKHTTYFFNCIVTHKYFSNSVYDDNSILCAGRVIR